MRTRTTGATAVLLGALLAVATACSSSTNGGGHGSGAPGSPAGTTHSTSSAAQSGGLTQQQAQQALLTASDVGSGFVQGPNTSSQSSPLPCEPSQPPLDERYSPGAKAEVYFSPPGGKAEVDEEIVVYADRSTAAQALAAGEKGLSCHSATLGSGSNAIRVALGGPKDLSDQLAHGAKVDKCEGWLVTASAISAELVVARIGPQLVVLSFTAAKSVDPTTLPNGQDIINKAIAKVDAVA